MSRNIFRRKKPVEVGPQTFRVRIVAIVVALAFAAILGRAWYVQVKSNELYISKSKSQHETTLTVNARRGGCRSHTTQFWTNCLRGLRKHWLF